MKNYFEKMTIKGSIALSSAILFFIIFLLPQNILAADSGRTTSPPMAGGPFVIWLICYLRRKKQIGGWLLYYFIGLYAGLLFSIALIFPSLPNYNPSAWDNMFHYFLFLITTIPEYIFLSAQVFISFYLISQSRRDWKHIERLKIVLLTNFAFSLSCIPVEVTLWPQSVFFSIYSAIVSIIWFFYFKKSMRVKYVFELKRWNWEYLHSIAKTTVSSASVGTVMQYKCVDCYSNFSDNELEKAELRCPSCRGRLEEI